MAKGFLTYSTAVILQAVANGYRYGFDIIDVTGMPGGTVYPALRRLVDSGCLTSEWEMPSISLSDPRPARKYYALTPSGRAALAAEARRQKQTAAMAEKRLGVARSRS